MGKQDTEMLKGVLEGLVLAVLAHGASHGPEVTASLRARGFADLAEGTVYAVLLRLEKRGLADVTKVPSPVGPPRKVFTLNAAGEAALEEFWSTWTALAARLDTLRTEGS
ncbi:PadR family transcriptional regulator [Serinibacter salmoneus]|uniref:PadR family transcriptional regulator PadR n=1 Tax=Serinibacter salmoneus TaxID=556530 RepID=A0A2A9D3G8_9MICO|nr:PadR family transcriptional regulator [Serinibacter salmoneus]PFG21204.1 PadR family transcriptional regulator PadR [Serinibacter salmoneus]